MAKRPHDTTIWKDQRWFRKLSPNYKLAFLYILDVCSHAGIWKIDYSQLVDDCGFDEFDLEDFIKKCNIDFDKTNGKPLVKERVRLIHKNSHIWITKFIQFQYEGKQLTINPKVPVVRSALDILLNFNVLEEALKKCYITLIEPYDNPNATPLEPYNKGGVRAIKHKANSIKHNNSLLELDSLHSQTNDSFMLLLQKENPNGKIQTAIREVLQAAAAAKILPNNFDIESETLKIEKKIIGRKVKHPIEFIEKWIMNFKPENETENEKGKNGNKSSFVNYRREREESFFAGRSKNS